MGLYWERHSRAMGRIARCSGDIRTSLGFGTWRRPRKGLSAVDGAAGTRGTKARSPPPLACVIKAMNRLRGMSAAEVRSFCGDSPLKREDRRVGNAGDWSQALRIAVAAPRGAALRRDSRSREAAGPAADAEDAEQPQPAPRGGRERDDLRVGRYGGEIVLHAQFGLEPGRELVEERRSATERVRRSQDDVDVGV